MRVWTHEERAAQLEQLRSLCGSLACTFADHEDVRAAGLFRVREINAGRLIAAGWTESELRELGSQFPDGAWWLNPKALDSGMTREPWQDEVAQMHGRARAVAMDLRSTSVSEERP